MRSFHQLLIDDEPDDPDVARLWLVTQVAKEFNVLPTVAAADMDSDPQRMTLAALMLLRYAAAKEAFDRDDEKELKLWRRSKMMQAVTKNAFDIHKAKMAARGKA